MRKFLLLFLLFTCIGLAKNSQDSLQCKQLNDRAMEIYLKNPDLAMKLIQQAGVKANAVNNNELIGLTKGNLATLKRMKGEFLESKKLSLETLKLATKPDIRATALNNLGACNRSLGLYNEAIKNYLEALKIHENSKNQEKQGTVNNNIGMVFSALGQMDKAKFYHKRALGLFIKTGYKKGLSESYNNIAIALANQDSVPKALHYFRKSLVIEQALKDKKGIAESVNNIGGAHYYLGAADSAIFYFRKSVKIEKELGNISGTAQSYNNIALVLLEKKDYKNAKQYTDSAYNYSEKSKVAADIMFSYQNYIQYYEETNNFVAANKFNKKYFTYKDSIVKAANVKEINELETKYEINKKEKLIAESRAAILEKDIAIKRTRYILIAIASLTFFTALIGFLIYRQQRLKNRQQEQEFQLKTAIAQIETQNKLQEQRLSISRDLHDNIGAQLTFIISSVDNIKHGFDIQNAKLNDKLKHISEFTKSTIVELRDTIWAMNNNEIKFEDLRVRILNFTEKAKSVREEIDFKFMIDESLTRQKLTSIAGMNIYRTIQEAVNNAIKYADAVNISIDAKNINGKLEIIITDDGKGFDVDAVERGNGIYNMQKRIEDIGGIFEIRSEISKGTYIRILFDKDLNA